MKIKGTAAKSIPEYVKKNHPDRFNEWFESLPADSQDVFKKGVKSTDWYDLGSAAVIPTAKIGEMFFNSANKGAWESGRYSAKQALNGIYKLYVMASKPGHIIDRASRVFSAYYQGSVMESVRKSDNSVSVVIHSFDQPEEIIENRIGGWMECALEVSGCKNVNVRITESLAKGDQKTLYEVDWN